MDKADSGLDPAVVTFVAVAKEYCRVLESEIVPLNRYLVQRLFEAILAIYTAGLKQPEVDPERKNGVESFFNSESRQAFFRTVADKLRDDYHYQMMFEPLDSDHFKAVTASLS